MTNNFDLIVIGAGPGGYELAAGAAAASLNVAVIERDNLGGTCLNRGCIPTKCLCAAADSILAANKNTFSISPMNPIEIDLEKVREHTSNVVSSLRDDIAMLLKNCTLIKGTASFTADGSVVVDNSQTFTAKTIVIATGSAPATLPIPGSELAIDSDKALTLFTSKHLDSLAIIGGGVIGLEMASAYAATGTKVTVVEFCPEILRGFDSDIARRLRSSLSRRGIKFITNAAASAIEQNMDSGTMTLRYTAKGKESSIECDHVLMAVGRRPSTPDGLDKCAIKTTSHGFIDVDSNFQTSRPGIYAIGDVAGKGPMLAHVASAQANYLLNNVILNKPHDLNIDFDTIPSVVFTNPPAFSVGIPESTAKNSAIEINTFKIPVASNGYARAIAHTEGLVKIISAADNGPILGIHYVGPQASALVAQAQLIVSRKLTAGDIHSTIFPHPTLTELIPSATP